jgi:hypothetical protein
VNPTPPNNGQFKYLSGGPRYDGGPLEHDPADDRVADAVLNELVRNPDPARWAEALSERYAEQTARVLRHFASQVQTALDTRTADLEDARRGLRLGDINAHELREIERQYWAWRHATMHFAGLCTTWLAQAEAAEARVRARLIGPLDELLAAIEQHRRGRLGLGQPTKADRMLWQAADRIAATSRTRPTSGPVDRTVGLTGRVAP